MRPHVQHCWNCERRSLFVSLAVLRCSFELWWGWRGDEACCSPTAYPTGTHAHCAVQPIGRADGAPHDLTSVFLQAVAMVCSMPTLESQRRSFDLFCLIRQSAVIVRVSWIRRIVAGGTRRQAPDVWHGVVIQGYSGSNLLPWTASCVFGSFADEFKRLCHLQIANCCRDNAGAEASGGCGFQVTGHQWSEVKCTWSYCRWLPQIGDAEVQSLRQCSDSSWSPGIWQKTGLWPFALHGILMDIESIGRKRLQKSICCFKQSSRRPW